MIILLPLLGFVFITLLITAGAMAWSPAAAVQIEQRLAEIGGTETIKDSRYEKMLVDSLKRIGKVAPRSPSEMGKLQQRLVAAGYRSNEALVIFFGVRVALALVVFVILGLPIILRPNLPMALGGAALGYMLPAIVLARWAKQRQHKIRLSLPDALDLLVVCVESGLGLDAALRKVTDEMKGHAKTICEEFSLANLQLQMGRPRREVLHDLGVRTGVDDVRSLAAILIQADRFGSSIAQALRVQSDSMRTRRRQLAEEKAAKTAVQLIFPLVLFIFPAIFVVLVGPASIKIIETMGTQ